MMRTRGSRTSLFLMELLLVLLFFSIASAVCVRVFTAAKLKSEASANLTAATFAAQSAAESWKSVDGNLEATAKSLSGKASQNRLLVAYDAQWKPCNKNAAEFVLTLDKEGSLGRIAVTGKDEKEIYTLSVRCLGGAD